MEDQEDDKSKQLLHNVSGITQDYPMISLPYEIPKPAVTDSEVPPVIGDESVKPVAITKKASKQQSNLQKLI